LTIRKGFLMPESALATPDFQPRVEAADFEDVPLLTHGNPESTGSGFRVPDGFRLEEVAVLSLLSEGNTAVQVARQMNEKFDIDMTKSAVEGYRADALEQFGTGSIALATHRAIKREVILVEVNPDEDVLAGLHKPDRHMIGLYARGVSNHRLAQTTKQPVKSVEAYHDRLLERTGAWSRPHLVRRGHELGLLH
jgi:hypothetical protein